MGRRSSVRSLGMDRGDHDGRQHGHGAEVALDSLIEACPSFFGATDLYDYMAWSEEEDEPDAFLRAAAFAQHVVRLVEARDVDEMPAVAATVERLLDVGDPDATELIRVGLIESLQNICSHDDVAVAADDVLTLLGPSAQEAWIELDELWAAASVDLQEGPRVTEEHYLGVVDPNLKLYLRTTKRRLPGGALMSMGDVLVYEHAVADATWRSPERRRRANRTAIVVGLLLALAVAVAVWR